MWATWAWEVRPCNRRVNWVDRSRSCGTFAQRINLLRPICSVNKGCIRRHTYVQLSRPLPPGQLKSTANSIYSPSVPVCRDCRDKRHDRSMSTARSTDQWQKRCFVSLFFLETVQLRPYNTLCVQRPTSADNAALLAVSADSQPCSTQSISSVAGRTANPPHPSAPVDKWDGQTDRQRTVT